MKPARRAHTNWWQRLFGASFLAGVIALQLYGATEIEAWVASLWRKTITIPRTPAFQNSLIPKDSLTLGMYRPELPLQYNGFYSVSKKLNALPKIISWYQAWGESDEHQFREKVVSDVGKKGFIPMITWEPWLSEFSRNNGAEPNGGLREIANGNYDSYIRSWARGVVNTRVPILIRWGHEMSNPWYSWSAGFENSPKDYIEAWKHVRKIFREEGAVNASFVWTPYLPSDSVYYPGDAEVDWIGLDIFNFGTVSENGKWLDFYASTKFLYDAFHQIDKPFLITEIATSDFGGNPAEWWKEAILDLRRKKFPKIRGLVFFDTPHGISPTGLPINWSLESHSEIQKLIRSALAERI